MKKILGGSEMFKSLQDCFVLSNGVKIPCVGFGTFLTPDGADTINSVKDALEIGYRHIDTATLYQNEASVGLAMRQSGLPRDEIFVTSKLWNNVRGYNETKAAFDLSMSLLELDVLDLYLIHFPDPEDFHHQWEYYMTETWRAFEDLYKAGRIRAIGVSNFEPKHLEVLKKAASIQPMVNQVRLHPGFTQAETVAWCRANNIVVESHSPLGHGAQLPTLEPFAVKYGRSNAQVCLRWHIQQDLLPLPKSVHRERIEQNAQIFDFTISEEDMTAIANLPPQRPVFPGRPPRL
jgi:diketogulonate reductase-like aldo/keto reductase